MNEAIHQQLFDVFLNIPTDIWRFIYLFLSETWWFLLFIILLPINHSIWLFWRQTLYKRSREYVLMEILIPREISRSPASMEQALKAIWGLRNWPEDVSERYWKGEITKWFTLEMVSLAGKIHFYIRTEKRQKDLVKAAFLSYYTEIEIVEVEDYISSLPKDVNDLEKKGLGLWGSEIVLARPEAYPIKMYNEFEGKEKEAADPISSFLEVLGEVRDGEMVGIQINIAPAEPNWNKRWEKFIRDLQKPKEIKTGTTKDGESKIEKIPSTPGEVAAIKSIDENLSSQAFDTLIRFVYISPQTIFFDSYARRGLIGAFNQYAAPNLNSFRQNHRMSTRTKIWVSPYIFPKSRNKLRKERILSFYRRREMPEETFMGRILTSHFLNWNFHSRVVKLTVRAVATLFHPPTSAVMVTPYIQRLEGRKVAPEVGLPIFGEEKALEKFGQ